MMMMMLMSQVGFVGTAGHRIMVMMMMMVIVIVMGTSAGNGGMLIVRIVPKGIDLSLLMLLG